MAKITEIARDLEISSEVLYKGLKNIGLKESDINNVISDDQWSWKNIAKALANVLKNPVADRNICRKHDISPRFSETVEEICKSLRGMCLDIEKIDVYTSYNEKEDQKEEEICFVVKQIY